MLNSVCFLYTADVTPPLLQFNSTPLFTNENVTLSWFYNEEASSFCVLQTPTALTAIPCINDSIALTHLEEGYHTLYVQGTDSSGNTATATQLSWTVGMIYTNEWLIDKV